MKHCARADLMVEYFNQSHAGALNEKLQSKFGEYADITVNTVADEDGGDIALSFGIYDLRDELANFSEEVAKRINKATCYEYDDFTAEEVERTINQYLSINNLNIDIDWSEDGESSITLFYNDKDYKSMNFDLETSEIDKYNFMILDELFDSVVSFLNETIIESMNEFNEAWVYSYSELEDECF